MNAGGKKPLKDKKTPDEGKLVYSDVIAEYGVKIIPDYTLAIYPLHVLSTNRILDTILSRKKYG